MYHSLVRQVPELKSMLIPDADYDIDLGGGFATPEISEIFSRSFVSYDILDPKRVSDWGLHLPAALGISEDVVRRHRQALLTQAFHQFDVFTDRFPVDGQAYNIVSFGFLNSPVNSVSVHQPALPLPLKRFATLVAGLRCILELVRLGKSVSLVAVSRPDLPLMNRIVHLRFEKGRILDISLPPHPIAQVRFAITSTLQNNLNDTELDFCSALKVSL